MCSRDVIHPFVVMQYWTPPKPFAVTEEKSSKNDASASSAGSGKGWKMLNK